MIPPFNLVGLASADQVGDKGVETGGELTIGGDDAVMVGDEETDELSFLKAKRTWRSGILGFFLPSGDRACFQSLRGCNSNNNNEKNV